MGPGTSAISPRSCVATSGSATTATGRGWPPTRGTPRCARPWTRRPDSSRDVVRMSGHRPDEVDSWPWGARGDRRDLAGLSPVVDSDLGDYCGMCGKVAGADVDLMVPSSHEPRCVWRRAK